MRGLLSLPVCVIVLVAGCHKHGGEDFDKYNCVGNEDALEPGFETQSQSRQVVFTLLDLEPRVFTVGELHSFTIEASDPDGEVIDDLNFRYVVVHGVETAEGVNPYGVPKLRLTGEPGVFEIADVEFDHIGPWRLEVKTNLHGATQTLNYFLCVE